jgi:anti-sigma factor RsiW
VEDAVHDLTAGYALNALDAREEAEYEAHLGRCAPCQAELASLQGTAASLAYGAPRAEPPPALRARILDEARRERGNVVPLRRRWALPAAATVAAVAAVAAIVLGVWASSLSSDLDRERAAVRQQQLVNEIVASPGAKRYAVAGGNGRLIVDSERRGALVLDTLPPAPKGKIFEAWVSSDGKTMLPAGTFEARDGGHTAVPLSRPVPRGGLVAVTIEDHPVDAPTDMPILTVPTT